MAEKKTPEVKTEPKVQTKYDRKMAARKQKEEQDKKDEKRFKIVSRIVLVVVVVGIIAGIAAPIYVKHEKLNGTYVEIGDRKVTGMEYDYYYNASVNSYLQMYSSMLPYLGLDVSQDFADQQYSDELTWKDMFDQMAVEQMRETYALAAEAEKNGFVYDTEAKYQEYHAELVSKAEAAGMSVNDYYAACFGSYATVENMEPILKEGFLAVAYNEELIAQNTPSDEEITAYYNENKNVYDKVDYRIFTVAADVAAETTDEAEIAKAMETAKAKADAFVAEREAGSDFEELCVQNATEAEKANYEDTETEYSLNEGKYNTEVPSDAVDWVYDDERAEGDITVIESTTGNQYYVIEFIQKYFDDASRENISTLLASETVYGYVNEWVEALPINDINGNFKYLTVDTTSEEATEEETTTE